MNTKTTIKGSPRNYSQAELETLQTKHRAVYAIKDAKENVSAALPYDFIMLIHNKLNEGYSLTRDCRLHLAPLNNHVALIKPESVQAQETAALDYEVRQAYIAELEQEREDYKKLLVQQLLEADQAKEAAKAEQAKAKKLADFEKQADECYGELKLPESE
jgi:hypothetical protein